MREKRYRLHIREKRIRLHITHVGNGVDLFKIILIKSYSNPKGRRVVKDVSHAQAVSNKHLTSPDPSFSDNI